MNLDMKIPIDYKSKEVQIDEKVYLSLIIIDDHSYLLLRNDWLNQSDVLMHCPDCKCMKK